MPNLACTICRRVAVLIGKVKQQRKSRAISVRYMITLNFFFFVGLGKCVRIDGATLLRAFCLASLDDVRELKEKKN